MYGLVELKTDVQTLGYDENGRLTTTDTELTLIPYYAWAHRGTGKMRVWLPQELNATTPVQPATLASQSKIEASYKESALTAINDGLVPVDEHDRSMGFYNWTPKRTARNGLHMNFQNRQKFPPLPFTGMTMHRGVAAAYPKAGASITKTAKANGYRSMLPAHTARKRERKYCGIRPGTNTSPEAGGSAS